MQQQTPRHNRWTVMSVTTMVVLLGTSAGCVSWKHCVNRHGLGAIVAENHDSRYYHCPHCGQIVPQEGFSKCPRCLQVPAYHGYEPTCWRQWPNGWGCPPESVVNNPEFWEQGMLESDHPAQEPPLASPSDEPSDDAEEVVPPAPDKSEVSVPRSTTEIAKLEPKAKLEQEVGSAVQPSQAAEADDVAVDSAQSPMKVLATEPVIEPAAVVSTESSADLERSIVVQEQPLTIQASTPVVSEPAVTAPTETNPALIAAVPLVQDSAEMAAESVSSSVLDLEHDQREVREAKLRSLQNPVDTEDVLAIVNRIPIPSFQPELINELSDSVDNTGVLAVAPMEPSIVRTPPAVINVTTKATGQKPRVPVATPETGFNPFDEQGPIPIRRVQLTAAELVSLPKAPHSTVSQSAVDNADTKSVVVNADVAKVRQEEYPVAVNRIALPQREPGYHPHPVRRIQLSELPVKIRR